MTSETLRWANGAREYQGKGLVTLQLFHSKFEEVALHLAPESRTLLDVGCRDGRLKSYIPPTKDRLRFLRGKERDKYKLEPQAIKDRHRWLTSYTTAHAFANHMAEDLGLSLTEAIMVDDRPNWVRELLARVLPHNLMSVAIFFLFVKSEQRVLADRVL